MEIPKNTIFQWNKEFGRLWLNDQEFYSLLIGEFNLKVSYNPQKFEGNGAWEIIVEHIFLGDLTSKIKNHYELYASHDFYLLEKNIQKFSQDYNNIRRKWFNNSFENFIQKELSELKDHE